MMRLRFEFYLSTDIDNIRSPTAADSAAVYWLDIYGRTFAGFCPQNPENPHEY